MSALSIPRASWVAVALATSCAWAQESDADIAARLFRERFVAAIRHAHSPIPDFDRCLAELGRAELVIPELIPARRGAARVGVAVRSAEVRVLQRRDVEAAQELLAARDAAIEVDAWTGSNRELANVLLWQIDPIAFARIWPDEVAFVRESELEQAARVEAATDELARDSALARYVPLRVLRASRELHEAPTARAAERDLLALVDRIEDEDRIAQKFGAWRDRALGVLAWQAMFQRDFDRAELHLRRMPEALVRYPRALSALRRGDFDRALREGQLLVAADPRFEHEQIVGHALEERGELDAALAAYQRARAVATTPLDLVVVGRGLGDVAYRRWLRDGDSASLRAARTSYETSLAALGPAEQTLVAKAELAQIEAALGRVAEGEGSPDRALARFERALAQSAAVRERFATSLSSGGSALAIEDVDAVEGVLRTFGLAGATGFTPLAAIESRRARTLLDWMAAPPGEDAATIANAHRFSAAVHELVLADGEALQESFERFERARLDAAVDISVQVASLGVDQMRAVVASEAARGTVFVSYWIGAERSWIVWTDRAGQAHVRNLGAAADTLGIRDRASTAVSSAAKPFRQSLLDASQHLLPVELVDLLLRSARVVLCPGPELSRLPFEALPLRESGDPDRAFGVALAVERAPSLSVRTLLARGKAFESQGAVGALPAAIVHSVDTEPELASLFRLDPLSFSAREAALVREVYSDAHELAGARATRAGLQALLAKRPFGVVHISAHAVFDPRIPTASLLALADGPVSVLSLLGLSLRGSLLVLSACSSATGERRAAEGELGLLVWPFVTGARGAVAALWPVNQQATMDLMGQFHFELASGADPAEAMRRARSTLSAAPNYEHPFYWGGFGVFSPQVGWADHGGATSWLGWGATLAFVALGIVIVLRRRGRA